MPLFGKDGQEYTLNADSMHYRDRFLELSGNVVISHNPNIFSCSLALIEYKPSEKEISQIDLKENVKIIIDDHSYLLCDKALIHVSEKLGILYKGEGLDRVKYFKDPNFRLECDKMTICYNGKVLSKIIATGDLVIRELEKYSVFGHEAIREQNGKISVYPEMIPNALCTIETFHNTKIQAESIHFDPEKKMISLHKARGIISTEQYPEMNFFADIVIWDEEKNILTLQGKIRINQNHFVSLLNDERVVFHYNKKELHKISASGHTEMNRFLDNGLTSYNLISDGEVSIDNKEKKIIIEKSKNQIQYSDHLGSIFGDRLVLSYKEQGKNHLPDQVSLEGNVRLIGTMLGGDANNSIPNSQYALADELKYSCEKKEMKLISHNKKRVLFYDKINNMQISAPGILYSKGKTIDKDVIKGLGDVRFRFMEQEFDHLKKRFNFNSGE